MSQILENTTNTDPQHSKKQKAPTNPILKIVKELLAFIFWFYVISKLFVFDIDFFLLNKFFPDYVRFLDYKFIILIGIVAVVWLVTKNKYILSWFFYILFYPLVILLWKIPFFVFKQKSWILTFALINSIISFFKSIKYTFISIALFLVSSTIILNFSNKLLLWVAGTTILGVLLVSYFHRFILIFKPTSVFQVHMKILTFVRVKSSATFALDDKIKNISFDKLNEEQIGKWKSSLEYSVLYNRICLFTSKKLRDYQNSKFNILYYVLTIMMLIFITIISFSLMNNAIYKINADFFKFIEPPSFFTFFYYSFNNLLNNAVPEITPVSPISQSVSMLEMFLALFLVAIFVTLIFSVKSKKQSDELSDVIKGIEEQGFAMEGFIRNEYRINSIEEAIIELEKLKAGLFSFIFKITENIK